MQKNGKKLLAWMLAASMVFSFSMPTQAAKKKPALSKKKAVITVGKTLTLKVKNISKKTKVTWKSKKKKIATVSKKGKVKAKKAGTAKITASFRYQGKKLSLIHISTNSVARRTGNVSAGTSVFSMVVLEKELSKVYKELDLVTTPSGDLVAMVHCNNCTSDLNAWVNIFREFAESFGMDVDMNRLYGTLYKKAMEGDANGGNLLAYNYISGENITEMEEGRPLFVRTPNSKFNLANFMRVNLYSALASLKIGMDLLLKEEKVAVDKLLGHGGLFKTKGVGQQILADAVDTPISVMETAGEGGAWGIAVLAAYLIHNDGKNLGDYLNEEVFAGQEGSELNPNPEGVK